LAKKDENLPLNQVVGSIPIKSRKQKMVTLYRRNHFSFLQDVAEAPQLPYL
jgi:hypothetical protein